MTRKIVIAIVVVLALVGALAGVKVMQVKKLMAAGASFAAPPETISSAVVSEQKWPRTLTAIGSVAAVQGVSVTTEVPGIIQVIAFQSGAVVKPGDLLVKLDVSSEEAQLRAVRAQLELARLNLERERALRGQNMVSQSDLDTAEMTMKQTQANADTISTTIEKKTIRAPFGGRLGIRMINLGQYLDTGKPIVSLQALTPIFANFSLPQQELSRLASGMRVRLTCDTYPDRTFEGSLTTINPDLDPSTRSIGLQATFGNQDQLLHPGMFARLEVMLPEEKSVLVVPITSVLSAPYGDSVYVIDSAPAKAGGKPELTVRQQCIRSGRTRGDFLSVESGLKAGERIVSSGIFKLRNKMSVIENNALTPKSEEAPKPADS
jgi:membrane fusion protein (multidrug efflux system)